MATITTLGTSDSGAVSRTTINDNFTNLNTDKLETSYLDTDTTLAADSDTKVATQKATKAYVDGQSFASFETTTGVTHSLTTTVGQTVGVWAKGDLLSGVTGTIRTLELKYDGVTKDTVTTTDSAAYPQAFALMYTESPTAGTRDITVTTSGGTMSNVVIMVQIIG